MSTEIIKMIKDIVDFDELQKFANTQYTVMITQAKKIEKLQEEVTKLSLLLDKSKQDSINSSILNTNNDQNNDTETICLIQLALLNRKSMEGELTLEETKKVETFSKVLLSLNTKDAEDKNKEEVKKIDTEQLLTLVGSVKKVE